MPQPFLGPDRDPADYERVTDILDVWFDSGCTHVFTLESGRWPEQRWPADLYLEGSDQHRGWFQSSLLESCGTRGRAPYDAVLTHGFTMDSKGMKMSKSLGNTINPLDLMKEHGADILRLWALSVDFTEDHRIGKEILAGVADQYRKLRNTFRYLLGALEGFCEDERVAASRRCPSSSATCCTCWRELDAQAARRRSRITTSTPTSGRSTDFCNEDLSAFYFDIRKDCLYCEVNPATGVRPTSAAPIAPCSTPCSTRWSAGWRRCWCSPAEEVWGTRYPGRRDRCICWSGRKCRASRRDMMRWRDMDELRALRTRSPKRSSRSAATRSSAPASKPKSPCPSWRRRRNCWRNCSSCRQ